MNTADKIIDIEKQKKLLNHIEVALLRKKEIENLFSSWSKSFEIKKMTDEEVVVYTRKIDGIYGIENYKTSLFYLHSVKNIPEERTMWNFKRDWSKTGDMEIVI